MRGSLTILLSGVVVACAGESAQRPPRTLPPGIGWIQPEIIQRVVRSHFSATRRCYQTGLAANPNLAGRVATKFVIDPNGEVHTALDAGSTMPDRDVVACIVGHFLELSFPRPQPEGTSVVVVYPIQFDP